MRNKAQAASQAAAFIAIMTVIIILYVLFLPPDFREEILGDNITSSGNETTISTTSLLRQTVGRITYVNTNEKSYDIPTVRINSPTSAQVIKMLPALTVKNALFDTEKSTYSLDFEVDRKSSENLMLSFAVRQHTGPLSVDLNGRNIFYGEISGSNPKPIPLDPGYLTDKNTLKFSVPSPGWTFWRANQYDLESVQITGDVTDYTNSQAVQHFAISESEKTNLDTLRLVFHPVCTISSVGPLKIELNGNTIFSGVADCGTRTVVALNKDYVQQGANELRFSTQKGTYLIDNIQVKLTLTKPAFNTYYFDLDESYFKTVTERARCGDYDGVCPAGCADIQDADCCFSRNGVWCALPTSNSNDRCAFYVDPADCGLCRTGYYDKSGDAPSTCENKCGDNNDGVCPAGCSRTQDKDCCYADNTNNFWCQESPISGVSDKCKASIRPTDCNLCPSGYINKDNDRAGACTGNSYTPQDDTYELLDDYDVTLKVRFANDVDRKRVDLNVNGHKISIDTTSIEYTRNIDTYVREGTNSIEIIPREDIDIVDIRVDVKRVR